MKPSLMGIEQMKNLEIEDEDDSPRERFGEREDDTVVRDRLLDNAISNALMELLPSSPSTFYEFVGDFFLIFFPLCLFVLAAL